MRRTQSRVGLMACAALAFGIAAGHAQVNPKLVVTGKDAETIGEMNMINGATAEAIAHACEKMAAEHGQSAVIVVLDNFGNVVHEHRMDGAARYTAVSTTEMKTHTAYLTRRPSSLAQYSAQGNAEQTIRQLSMHFLPAGGGLPIWAGKQIIGFVGVGGQAQQPSWTDEMCAYEALVQVVGPQPPLPQRPAARAGN